MTLRETVEATILEHFHSPDSQHSSWWIRPAEMAQAIFVNISEAIQGVYDNTARSHRHWDEEDWERQGYNQGLDKVRELMTEQPEPQALTVEQKLQYLLAQHRVGPDSTNVRSAEDVEATEKILDVLRDAGWSPPQ